MNEEMKVVIRDGAPFRAETMTSRDWAFLRFARDRRAADPSLREEALVQEFELDERQSYSPTDGLLAAVRGVTQDVGAALAWEAQQPDGVLSDDEVAWPEFDDGRLADLGDEPDDERRVGKYVEMLAETFMRQPSQFATELRASGLDDEPPERRGVYNYRLEVVEREKDGKKRTDVKKVPLLHDELLWQIDWQTGMRVKTEVNGEQQLYLMPGTSWPRAIGNTLFVPDRQRGVWFIEDQHDLMAYLQSYNQPVEIWGGDGAINRGDLLSIVRKSAQQYTGVELYPHEPRVDGLYYACEMPEPGDGSALRELLNRFEFASEADKHLGLAAMVTPAWGGPTGARPLFVIADPGDGENDCETGKSTFVQMIGLIWGDCTRFNFAEGHWGESRMRQRLLDEEGLTRRMVLIDNVKSNKMSWAELEALITSYTINGHALNQGDRKRPNLLSWYMTVNGRRQRRTWPRGLSSSGWACPPSRRTGKPKREPSSRETGSGCGPMRLLCCGARRGLRRSTASGRGVAACWASCRAPMSCSR